MAVRVVVLALALLGACDVGEVPVGGGGAGSGLAGGKGDNGNDGPDAGLGGQTPQQSFTSVVAPLVARCTGCHSGAQSPNLTSFDALEPQYKAKPGASNILTTKGDHEGIIFLTPTERMTVASWIDGLP